MCLIPTSTYRILSRITHFKLYVCVCVRACVRARARHGLLIWWTVLECPLGEFHVLLFPNLRCSRFRWILFQHFVFLSVGWDMNQFYMFLECHKNAVELAKFHRSFLNHRKFLQHAYFGYYIVIYYRLAWSYHFCSIFLAWSQIILQPVCYCYANGGLKYFA